MTLSIAGLLLAASTTASAAGRVPLPLPTGCEVASAGSTTAIPHRPVFPPVQLEIHTPFEPTIFSAGGYNYLLYEVHLQNFTDAALAIHGVDVLDADTGRRIALLGDQRLFDKLVAIGADAVDGDHPLQAGRKAVAFVCLALDSRSAPPARLRHRVLLANSVAEGPAIGTGNRQPKVLAPPVSGADWMAVSGLTIGSHHRSGLFVVGGVASISRRYAVDWKRKKQDAFFSGDARDVRSYHAYGNDVLAVADAKVVVATDGLPDNIPRTAAGFATALPVTMETIAGNSVVLDLGGGQFASYAHLKPGSLRVKVGDRVRRGQRLALIGNSGDSREPHLHFQVTDGPDILASEGLPFVVDEFRMATVDGSFQTRKLEFPLGHSAIDFSSD